MIFLTFVHHSFGSAAVGSSCSCKSTKTAAFQRKTTTSTYVTGSTGNTNACKVISSTATDDWTSATTATGYRVKLVIT